MRILSAAVALGALLLAAPPDPAAAANRVALVIGNNEYDALEDLQNPIRDAEAYAALLERRGYAVVTALNATRIDFDAAIAEFIEALGPGDTAVVVYSGHGWASEGQNFLVPTDTPVSGAPALLRRLSVPIRNGVNGLLDEVAATGAALTIAIIDACRDNPFGSQLATRSGMATRGLTRVDPARGSFIAFSADVGQAALDYLPTDRNRELSVFAREFLPLLEQDYTLLDAMKIAQARVRDATLQVGHNQQPAYYDGVVGDACLVDECVSTRGPIAAAREPDPALGPGDVARLQELLAALGYDAGAPDGVVGLRTIEAVAAYEADQGRPVTGDPSAALLAALEGALADPSVSAPGIGRFVDLDRFKDCGDCPEMVVMPSATFTMGLDPEDLPDASTAHAAPARSVAVERFALGAREVTRRAFGAFVLETGHRPTESCRASTAAGPFALALSGSWSQPNIPQGPDHPVVCISYDDAVAYALWMSSKTGERYRLPSEAELAYAIHARAEAEGLAPIASDAACLVENLADQTLAEGNPSALQAMDAPYACEDGHVFTAPVGAFRPNAFGLYDANGNVAEWTLDCWADGFDGAPLDAAPRLSGAGVDCALGVVRGADWLTGEGVYTTRLNRSAIRRDDATDTIGFRLARDIE